MSERPLPRPSPPLSPVAPHARPAQGSADVPPIDPIPYDLPTPAVDSATDVLEEGVVVDECAVGILVHGHEGRAIAFARA